MLENFYVILIVCNCLDILTGLIKAIHDKELKSSKLRDGAVNKAMIWCVVIASYFGSSYVGFDLTKVTLGYYIIMELVSIVENAGQFIPVPEELKKYLTSSNSGKNSYDVSKETDTVPENILNEIEKNQVDPEILKIMEEKK